MSGVYEIVTGATTLFETAFGKDEKVCKLASPLIARRPASTRRS